MPGWAIGMDEKERWESGMDKKILILSQTTKDDYALMEWEKNGVDTDITLKDCNRVLRAIRRLWIKFHLPLQHVWYGDWTKRIADYDMILIHGTWLAEDIPHWLRKKAQKENPDLKIIWWYWNHVVDADHPDRVSEEDCEKWSFDQKDCQTYHMNYNTQYYFRSYKVPQDLPAPSDIYYLGTEGGRLPFLMGLHRQFTAMDLKTDFNIFVTDPSKIQKGKEDCFITKKMDYQDNLRHIGACKAVLEILREGQSGQTLRPLECLFHQRKLITNDRSIDGMIYYHPDNIFILEKDDIETLPAFLEKPFVPIPEHVVNIYESQSWLERFYLESGEG